MSQITPYLIFNDGFCKKAMNFYQGILGGDLEMMTYSSSPVDVPPEYKERIIHGMITGPFSLMASDGMPHHQVQQGSNVHISVNCRSFEEIERFFKAFSENGKVTMPLQDTFWGARFGMLVDQFGICWMFSFQKDSK
ncbi:VOC family protein [Bdellovibrio bacteriovorus]|uniref:VOC family protein n=1 Tax=Bdellovibrio TaxID=958 RepID=UPI0035A854F0